MFKLKKSLTICENLTSLMHRKFLMHKKACQKNYVHSRPSFRNRRKYIDLSVEDSELRSVFPQLKDTMLKECLIDFKDKPEFNTRFSKLIDYSLNLDSQFLGTSLVFMRAYKHLVKPSLQTDDQIRKAAILAWSFKITEAAMILVDDIIDKSLMRYNKPTWYQVVGENEAIFDASFLQSGAQFLLMNFISDHPQYLNIERDSLRNYCSTQLSQIIFSRIYELHELEKNVDFVKAYPFAVYVLSAALYFVNITDPKSHSAVRDFAIKIAEFLKNQDDTRCITTSVKEMGKICTDTMYGKPSWLLIEAFKRSNPVQRKILENMHNKNTVEAVEEIENIFQELNLKAVFKEYEENTYESMLLKIEKLPKELPKQLFLDILDFSFSDKLCS